VHQDKIPSKSDENKHGEFSSGIPGHHVENTTSIPDDVEKKMTRWAGELGDFAEHYLQPAFVLVCKRIGRTIRPIWSQAVDSLGPGKSVALALVVGVILVVTAPFWVPFLVVGFIVAVVLTALSLKQ
jgi:hypothetical protein